LLEFAWRRKIAFQPLGSTLRTAISATLASDGNTLDAESSRELLIALMRDIRLADESPSDEVLTSLIEQYGSADDVSRLETGYQRCLLARDKSDLTLLDAELRKLKSDDPVWKIRIAALWAEVGYNNVASRLLAEANDELDHSYRLDRASLWIKSRLAWANTLYRMSDADRASGGNDRVQTREFKELSIDPIDEINRFRNLAQEIQANRYEVSEVTPLFSPGHYRESPRSANGEADESSVLNRYELDQLIEFAGIPARLNQVNYVAFAMTGTAKVTYDVTYDWYIFLIRGLHSQNDKPFEKYFGRTAIARLSNEVSQALIKAVLDGIEFWIKRGKESHGDDRKVDWRFAVDRLRLFVNVLSRLSVRMTEDEAKRTFKLGIDLAVDSGLVHPWLYAAFGDLGQQASAAISPLRRGGLALAAVKFPLAAERGVQARNWPNPATWLWSVKPSRETGDMQWSARVSELLAAVAVNNESREDAAVRLAYLSIEKVLTSDEEKAFGDALWSITDGTEFALPIKAGLLDSTFLELPSPDSIDKNQRLAYRLFEMDLHATLPREGSLDSYDSSDCQSRLLSMKNAYKLGLRPSALHAAKLFDQIVDWSAPTNKEGDPFLISTDRFHNEELLLGDVLAQVIVSEMKRSDITEERFQRYRQFVERNRSGSGLSGLIYFLKELPGQHDIVTKLVDRSMIGANQFRVANAAVAMIVWPDVTKDSGVPELSSGLLDKLVTLIAVRHGYGLSALLIAATSLLGKGEVVR